MGGRAARGVAPQRFGIEPRIDGARGCTWFRAASASERAARSARSYSAVSVSRRSLASRTSAIRFFSTCQLKIEQGLVVHGYWDSGAAQQ